MVLEIQFSIFFSFLLFDLSTLNIHLNLLSTKIISYTTNIIYSAFFNYFRPFAFKEPLQTKTEQNALKIIKSIDFFFLEFNSKCKAKNSFE